jgi:hypothetical protein
VIELMLAHFISRPYVAMLLIVACIVVGHLLHPVL